MMQPSRTSLFNKYSIPGNLSAIRRHFDRFLAGHEYRVTNFRENKVYSKILIGDVTHGFVHYAKFTHR